VGILSLVSGYISLKGDGKESLAFIRNLKDKQFPWFRSEMFSHGATESPYYYDHQIVGFAASYKGVELDWTPFVMKFEHILRHLNFYEAKIELQAEWFGRHEFIWMPNSKDYHGKESLLEKGYIETGEWLFKSNNRNLGFENALFDHNFTYPLTFDVKLMDPVNEMLQKIAQVPLQTKIFLNDYLPEDSGLSKDRIYDFLVYLSIQKEIEYGVVSGKGYWLKKLVPVVERIESYDYRGEPVLK